MIFWQFARQRLEEQLMFLHVGLSNSQDLVGLGKQQRTAHTVRPIFQLPNLSIVVAFHDFPLRGSMDGQPDICTWEDRLNVRKQMDEN